MKKLKSIFKKDQRANSDSEIAKSSESSSKKRSIFQICEENGYSLEKHKYTTKDGYINTVCRLTKDRQNTDTKLQSNWGKTYEISNQFNFENKTLGENEKFG